MFRDRRLGPKSLRLRTFDGSGFLAVDLRFSTKYKIGRVALLY
jgi:hypothetical protein